MSLCKISHVTKSIPVWFEWQVPYHLYTEELEVFWPSQSQINQARCSNKGKGKVLDNGYDSWGDVVLNDEIVTMSGALDKGWDFWGDAGTATTSGTLDKGWDSWGDTGIVTMSSLMQTAGLTHPMTPLFMTHAE